MTRLNVILQIPVESYGDAQAVAAELRTRYGHEPRIIGPIIRKSKCSKCGYGITAHGDLAPWTHDAGWSVSTSDFDRHDPRPDPDVQVDLA